MRNTSSVGRVGQRQVRAREGRQVKRAQSISIVIDFALGGGGEESGTIKPVTSIILAYSHQFSAFNFESKVPIFRAN